MQLAHRLDPIKVSPTLAMSNRAREMKAKGVDVVSFAVGEPDFPTPEHICQAAVAAIQAGEHKYTQADGTPALKEAIIGRLKKDLGVTYTPAEIVVTCGGKHAIYQLAQAVLDPGDEVVIPAPYWVSYPDIVLLAEATPVIVPTSRKEGFKLTPEKLLAAVTPKTKALILNSPSNPTGGVYDRAEMAALAKIALDKGFCIWSDEIYDKLVFDGQKAVSPASLGPECKEAVVVLNGASKAYAMTGWRIGWLAASKPVARAVAMIQSQSTSNPCSIAQAAAVAALNGPEETVERMVAVFDRRRKLFLSLLSDLEVKIDPPKGAFYLFPDFRAYLGGKIKDDTALADYLLEEAHVATMAGTPFGAEGFLRFSYATSEERIETGMKRIKAALQKIG